MAHIKGDRSLYKDYIMLEDTLPIQAIGTTRTPKLEYDLRSICSQHPAQNRRKGVYRI